MSMMDKLFGWIGNIFNFLGHGLDILPDSFLTNLVGSSDFGQGFPDLSVWEQQTGFKFLEFLNWFIPFYDFVNMLEAFTVLMATLFVGKYFYKILGVLGLSN